MVLWVMLMLGLRVICVVASKQSSLMVASLLGVLLELVYHKLGLLLFSIFVNDLPSVVDHAQINMYAHDTELHCCGEDLQSVQNDLQSDLYRIQDWLQANRLQLNISKSMIMLIGSWQKLRN